MEKKLVQIKVEKKDKKKTAQKKARHTSIAEAKARIKTKTEILTNTAAKPAVSKVNKDAEK